MGVNDILTHPTASELAELPAFQRLDKQEGQFANAVNKRPVRHADQEELEGIVQYSYMASGYFCGRYCKRKDGKRVCNGSCTGAAFGKSRESAV